MNPAHVVLLQKSWQAFAGLVTATLVTKFLSPQEQGYYYAMGSLLSGYILLDLGLSGLLVQASARMASEAGGSSADTVPSSHHASLGQCMLLHWSQRWYAKLSLLSLLLLPLGFIYFNFASRDLPDQTWQGPWIVIVFCVAASMPAYPLLAILEGIGYVSEAYWVRLLQYFSGAVAAWLFLITGYGLFALATAPLAVAVVTFVWRRSRHQELFAIGDCQDKPFSWRESLWPLQRKVAVSWLASYLFLNIPTLVVFYFGSAAVAGQLGLSIVVANLLGSLCASWLIAKVPRITQLLVQGQVTASDALFWIEFRKAIMLMVGGYAGAIVLVLALRNTAIGNRILAPVDITLLFGAFAVFHAVTMLSVYFRARGRESLAGPLMGATVAGLAGALAGVHWFGVKGVLMALLLAYMVVALPGMYFAWARSRGNG